MKRFAILFALALLAFPAFAGSPPPGSPLAVANAARAGRLAEIAANKTASQARWAKHAAQAKQRHAKAHLLQKGSK